MADNDILESEEYLKEFEKQVKIVTDINMSTLAEYVARRKAVLNILSEASDFCVLENTKEKLFSMN